MWYPDGGKCMYDEMTIPYSWPPYHGGWVASTNRRDKVATNNINSTMDCIWRIGIEAAGFLHHFAWPLVSTVLGGPCDNLQNCAFSRILEHVRNTRDYSI